MREYVFVAPVTNLIFFSIFNPIIYIKYLTIKDMFYLTCFFSIKAITNYQKSMNKVKKKKNTNSLPYLSSIINRVSFRYSIERKYQPRLSRDCTIFLLVSYCLTNERLNSKLLLDFNNSLSFLIWARSKFGSFDFAFLFSTYIYIYIYLLTNLSLNYITFIYSLCLQNFKVIKD